MVRVGLDNFSLVEVEMRTRVDNVVVGWNLQYLDIPLIVQGHCLGVLSPMFLDVKLLHHNLSLEEPNKSSKKKKNSLMQNDG